MFNIADFFFFLLHLILSVHCPSIQKKYFCPKLCSVRETILQQCMHLNLLLYKKKGKSLLTSMFKAMLKSIIVQDKQTNILYSQVAFVT